jgi:hypothetical protein
MKLPEIVSVELQRGLLDLRLEIIRQFPADLVFDHQPCFPVRYAEKAIEHLIGRDRVAVTCQGFRMRAA